MSDQEKVFGKGIIAKKPHEKAPDFVKMGLSFKVDEFIEFLKEHDKNGWVNMQVKESKGGKIYAELDTWEKKETTEKAVEVLPF